MTVLVAKFRNRRDADIVAGLIKRFRKNTKVLKGEKLEDLYLGEMIEDGMKEKGEISGIKFATFLEKKNKTAGYVRARLR